ncbi:alpha/beta fold hydrolase [Parasedimentitalea maritima]|uniref:alpha/beta fold hydrolase n=1 Tax=Parasedimentitalea maritima TaxID=2578117 RepID=UPI00131C950F|nr:alpha/beta hydrolase [Zongyanglinia marina]
MTHFHAPPYEYAILPLGRTHYQFAGPPSGEVVVLIHGNAAPLITWDETVGPLVDAGYRVLRYDLFGHGLSDVPTLRRYDKTLYENQLSGLLEILKIDKPVAIVGTSQGGTIAAQFTVRFPDRVTKVCMLAPFVDNLERKLLALLRQPVFGELLIRMASCSKLMDQSACFMDSRVWAAFRDRLQMVWSAAGRRVAILANLRGDALEDASEVFRSLAALRKPVRLLWGDQDQSISRHSISHLRDLVPKCDYSELQGAAHLMHVEFPERINPLVVEFLGAQNSNSRP